MFRQLLWMYGVLQRGERVKTMRLGKTFRLLYDAHMKQICDRNARDGIIPFRAEHGCFHCFMEKFMIQFNIISV